MSDLQTWAAVDVKDAILNGNPHLEIVFCNYLDGFVSRLGGYDIPVQSISTLEGLQKQILSGIDALDEMRNEILSVIGMFANCNHPLLEKYLHGFLERLLNFYEDRDINLHTGDRPDALRNDHYRYFNQSFFISLTAELIENSCFQTLRTILYTKYQIYYKSLGTVSSVAFMQFRKYNYTLNELLNKGPQKRISVTADYIKKRSTSSDFGSLVRADILLYYISLWNTSEGMTEFFWFPELSVYNRDKHVLPQLASKSYFEKAKKLFGVHTILEYKNLLQNTEDLLERDNRFRVPLIKTGLMYDEVGRS